MSRRLWPYKWKRNAWIKKHISSSNTLYKVFELCESRDVALSKRIICTRALSSWSLYCISTFGKLPNRKSSSKKWWQAHVHDKRWWFSQDDGVGHFLCCQMFCEDRNFAGQGIWSNYHVLHLNAFRDVCLYCDRQSYHCFPIISSRPRLPCFRSRDSIRPKCVCRNSWALFQLMDNKDILLKDLLLQCNALYMEFYLICASALQSASCKLHDIPSSLPRTGDLKVAAEDYKPLYTACTVRRCLWWFDDHGAWYTFASTFVDDQWSFWFA